MSKPKIQGMKRECGCRFESAFGTRTRHTRSFGYRAAAL